MIVVIWTAFKSPPPKKKFRPYKKKLSVRVSEPLEPVMKDKEEA